MDRLIYDVDSNGVIWQHWYQHAIMAPDRDAIVHMEESTECYRWKWEPLMQAASSAARWLADKGVKQGDVCALILRHNKHFYPLYMGISALGALPAVLAYPNPRLHPAKFAQGLEGMSAHSGLDHVLTELDLEPMVGPILNKPQSSVRSLLFPLEEVARCFDDGRGLTLHPACSADDPCLLQHSSGTTGLQKPVILSHRAVLEHVRRYGAAIKLDYRDKVATWLPLYHDMGLIAAFYLPLVCGIPIVQLSPLDWVSAPVTLMNAISEEKATLCWLPNFAYNFMADRIRNEDMEPVRLDSIRMLVNCSEPVRATSHDRFYRKFEPFGLRQDALTACYAMAETTFAVTQTPSGQPARSLAVNRGDLAQGTVTRIEGTPSTNARICVSSGIPIDGCTVQILGENREVLPPRMVGEIAISSISMFDGYRNHPEKTSQVLNGDWYYSGDYGFLDDGELFVIGRKKDLIIVAGNNVFPEDVEDAVGKVPGIIPGRTVAFGTDDDRLGTEILCVIAESELTSEPEKKALRLAIVQAGMAIDVSISRVYLVPPRWMVKSSSGKPARSTNRSRALEEIPWR